MDRFFTLMVAQDTALDLVLRPVEGFYRLSRLNQAELVWEYTNMIMKYPCTSLFNFWQKAAESDIRDMLESKGTDNPVKRMLTPFRDL